MSSVTQPPLLITRLLPAPKYPTYTSAVLVQTEPAPVTSACC